MEKKFVTWKKVKSVEKKTSAALGSDLTTEAFRYQRQELTTTSSRYQLGLLTNADCASSKES